MKTFSFNGTSANLPNVIFEISAMGLSVHDVRYTKWINEEGEVTGDRIDVDADVVPPENEKYFVPIETPALYADDVFVSSRDIKDDPLEALAEALNETKKEKGEPKSLDIIARSTLRALEHAMKEIDKLRLDVEQLRKKVK